MEGALVGFVAGLAGAAALNFVLAPIWELSGIRDRLYVELLLCSQIKPKSYESVDISYNASKLLMLAAELQAFDRSASRLTRVLVARRGYNLRDAVEAVIDLSKGLRAHAIEVDEPLERARLALRLPALGFFARGDPEV